MDGTVRETRDEPAVDSPDGELPGLCPGAKLGILTEEPSDLGAREVRIEHESGSGPDLGFVAGCFQLLAHVGGAAVLPNDGTVGRFERLPIPKHEGLALVGDADRAHVGARCRVQRFSGNPARHIPDFHGVVLDPPGLREILGELGVRPAEHRPVLSDDEAGRTGGALVDGQNGWNAHRSLGSTRRAAARV